MAWYGSERPDPRQRGHVDTLETIGANEPLREAARRMSDSDISALVVTTGGGCIVTQSDIVGAVAEGGRYHGDDGSGRDDPERRDRDAGPHDGGGGRDDDDVRRETPPGRRRRLRRDGFFDRYRRTPFVSGPGPAGLSRRLSESSGAPTTTPTAINTRFQNSTGRTSSRVMLAANAVLTRTLATVPATTPRPRCRRLSDRFPEARRPWSSPSRRRRVPRGTTWRRTRQRRTSARRPPTTTSTRRNSAPNVSAFRRLNGEVSSASIVVVCQSLRHTAMRMPATVIAPSGAPTIRGRPRGRRRRRPRRSGGPSRRSRAGSSRRRYRVSPPALRAFGHLGDDRGRVHEPTEEAGDRVTAPLVPLYKHVVDEADGADGDDQRPDETRLDRPHGSMVSAGSSGKTTNAMIVNSTALRTSSRESPHANW